MNANNGGPAFPNDNGDDRYNNGMTLRDWFAGQALAGRIASTRDPEASEWDATWWARKAYETADAMLKAREAKP